MQPADFWTILIILAAHLLAGLIAVTFGVTSSESDNSSNFHKKVAFFGVNTYSISVGTAVFDALPPKERHGLFFETISKMSQGLDDYSRLPRVRALVVMAGTNDFAAQNIDEDLRRIADKLPVSSPLLWFAVPPVSSRIETRQTNAQITEFNRRVKELCAVKANCRFIDPTSLLIDENGDLKSEYHDGDGITFNKRGSEIWVNALKSNLPAIEE